MWIRVRKSFVALLCGQGILAFEQLLLVPIFLIRWSPNEYGQWLSLSALMVLVSLSDFGMNTGGAILLTRVYAQDDKNRFRTLQDSAMAFYLFLAAAGTLALAAAIFAFPSWCLFDRELVLTAPVRGTLWLLGLQTLWGMPFGSLNTTHRALGDMAVTQWWINARQLATAGFTAAVLLLGGHMMEVAGAELAALLFSAGGVWWHCRRRHPTHVPGVSRARLSALLDLLRPSLYFWTINVSQLIGQSVPLLMVRVVVGEVAVAVFSVSRTAVTLVRQGITLLHNALLPELTQMEAIGKMDSLRFLHRLLMAGSSVLAIAAAGFLWPAGDSLIRLWTSGALPSDAVLLRLWLIHLLLQIPWISSSIFQQAANRLGLFTRSLLLSSVLGTLLSIFLATWLKSWAVPVGFAIVETAVCSHFVIRETCRILQEPYGAFARWFWKGWLLVLIGVFVTAGVIGHLTSAFNLLQKNILLGGIIVPVALLLAQRAWSTRIIFLWLLAQLTRRFRFPGVKRFLPLVCNPDSSRPGDHFEYTMSYESTFLVKVDTASFLEWSVFFFGRYEPEVTRQIRRHLFPGAVAFDVGANVGFYTLVMAKAVEERGIIIAVEPHPEIFQRLCEHLELNKLHNVIPLRCALGTSLGRAVLRMPAAGNSNKGCSTLASVGPGLLPRSADVEVQTVDEIVRIRKLSHLDLIKIDTEGWDLRVLQGAEGSLQSFHPVIIFEYTVGGWGNARVSFKEAQDWISALGYRLFVIRGKRLIPLQERALPDSCNLLAVHDRYKMERG